MVLELTVCLKDAEGSRNYRHKCLVYDPLLLNEVGDSGLLSYINEAVKAFGEKPDHCKIKISMEVT